MRMEVRESKAKNLFWAVSCTLIGSAFLISIFYEVSYWIAAIGILFLLGSLLFYWAAFSNKLVVSIGEAGIWTYIYETTIPWAEIEEIRVEDRMLVVTLSDVDSLFPESSTISKRLLKRIVVDLGQTDANVLDLIDLINARIVGSTS